MYVCKDCGTVFYVPHRRRVIDDIAGCAQYRVVETHDLCPTCHSENIIGGEVCKGCGQIADEQHMTLGYCESCLKKLEREAVEILRENMIKSEFDALRVWLDLPEVDKK